MQVRITIDLEWETGEYDIVFKSLSDPGSSIDYTTLRKVLNRVFTDLDNKVDCEGEA